MTLQQPDPSLDSFGQPIRGWSTVAVVYGAVEPINGKEFFTAQQINAETTTRIRIRYGSEIASISEDWRVVFDGRNYNIKAIIMPSEIQREIILMCGEGINDGG